MKNLVVLTGAGISVESGLQTFRGQGGLWEGYNIEDVATPEAWEHDPRLVLEFYNARRKQLDNVKPNPAHFGLAELERSFNVQIVTQNVDDLHERAGSSNVLHLHGELTKCRCTGNESLLHDMGSEGIKWGEQCKNGHQLRPHIVWFGEEVPKLHEAAYHFAKADIQVVIGTSLKVYPAASLVQFSGKTASYVVDPDTIAGLKGFEHYKVGASEGMIMLQQELKKLA
jgi:NAD-dependent deacetylase